MYIISGLFNVIHTQYPILDIELDAIFKECGEDISKLNNPIAKLDIGVFGRYIELLVKYKKNNRIGLEAGFRIPFILTATFFNLYPNCSQMRNLFVELGKYDSTTNNITKYITRQADDLFYYEISVNPEFANQFPVAARQWIEMQYGMALQYAYIYTGRFVYPDMALSVYGKEGKKDLLEEYLNCPIKFNQENSALIFDKSVLDLPVIILKKELFPIFENTMEIIGYKYNKHNLSNAVRAYLMHSLSTSALNLKPIAERFHMSERNIQRKLKAEGTSYQQILDNLRMELAQKYLRVRMPLVEIAFLLGFESQSAFNKFFNKHFHTTPSQFE